MALIPEIEDFAETVNFNAVDINEPVLGGLSPEGPINRIARILGSRTLWLRALIQQVQYQGLRFKFITPVTANYVIARSDAGGALTVGGTASGISLTLPNSSNPSLSYLNGETITIKNNNPNNVTIQRHPSATGDTFDNGSIAFILRPGDTVTLTYDETAIWYVLYRIRTKDNVGVVSAFAGSSPPEGYALCNGAAVSRTTYAYLFGIIGTTYGSGDGSTTFNLPDLRGEFIRGLDAGRGVDSGRTLGSAQSDALKAHTHDVETSNQSAAGTDSKNPNTGGSSGNETTTSFGSTETRPRNIAMNYIIYHGVI